MKSWSMRAKTVMERRAARLDDRGMATVEYAMVTVAAAAFAGVLVALIRSDEVRELLAGVLRGAFGG
ncbi:DUF4244 domain-containing protein [Demequina sp. NBRC 110052]|uniref:DUF4244 domain-containing protein n=1 Tax=Demequina sp. NBRC 110052 TaxID=1570341 RepID=UPI001F3BEA8A|nr:DUF4244 domain-containing protein [Demequina sp. NBRC 110052]